MVLADTGEDTIVICKDCDYAANMEKASCVLSELDKVAELPIAKVETPGKRKVAAVTEYLKISPENLVKTMVFMADGNPVAVLLRGDHEVQTVKLQNFLGVNEVELASDQQVFDSTGVPSGYLGPIGIKIPVVADIEVTKMKNFAIGANEKNYHYIDANFGRDFEVGRVADLRMVTSADRCSKCGNSLELTKGIEVGHIFKLGTAYSEALNAKFLDRDGQEKVFIMGCYGIGVSRVAAAAIEQNHDKDGIIFPMPIAPMQVIILNLGVNDEKITVAAESLYENLKEQGVEVLLDDRDERPGSKFKDADLIGIPLRVMVGKKFEKEGLVEIRKRSTGKVTEVPFCDAAAMVIDMIELHGQQGKG